MQIPTHPKRRNSICSILRRFIRIRKESIIPPRTHDHDCTPGYWRKSQKCSEPYPVVFQENPKGVVAVSMLSAEATAFAGAMDLLAWCRLFWGWLMDQKYKCQLGDKTLSKLPPAFSAFKDEIELKDPNQSLSENLIKLQIIGKQDSVVATDCKSLFDLVNRTASPACQEFRTLLEAKLIKEHLATGVAIRWVPSSAQVANCLTKTCLTKTWTTPY